MSLIDRLPQTGILDYTVRRRGRVIEVVHEKNLIVNGARNAMAQLLGGDGAGKTINRIGFGSNGTAPVGTDTVLTGAFVKLLGVKTYPGIGMVRWAWSLATTEANGLSIGEFGLFCTDDTLLSRKNRARGAIEKDLDVDLDGTWTILF
jgi:hypothetical protein